jgi:hypothetical protein
MMNLFKLKENCILPTVVLFCEVIFLLFLFTVCYSISHIECSCGVYKPFPASIKGTGSRGSFQKFGQKRLF